MLYFIFVNWRELSQSAQLQFKGLLSMLSSCVSQTVMQEK